MNPDDRLMAATMTWLRAVLVPPRPTVPSPVAPEPGRRWRTREPIVVAPPTPAPAEPVDAHAARRAVEEALAADPAPRFARFCERLGMGPFERDVALLCVAHAVSTEIGRRCAAMPESTAGAPTFALALALAADEEFDATPRNRRSGLTRIAAEPEWSALAPDGPLRRWRVLEVGQAAAGQALVGAALRMDERIVNHVRGHDHLDARLAPLVEPVAPPDGALTASQTELLESSLAQLRDSAPGPRFVVQMPGGDAATKRLFAARLARECGAQPHRVAVPHLPDGPELAAVVDLWNREVRLGGVALLVHADELDPASSPKLGRLLARLTGLVLLDVPELLPDVDTAVVLDVARPTPAEQRTLWSDALPGAGAEWPDRLAGQFSLNPDGIAETAAAAGGSPERAGERAWARCRERGRPRLEGLAHRVTTATRLADVQLPEQEKRQLERVRDQVRHRVRVYDGYGFRERLARGLGITVLLAGESGTGKTMATEALANDLELDLYRIDLSSVVSKYIGETEKNLRRVFDAAEQSGAVLLFDEADALFGRRSEVRDSHDRYANIEIGYLLTRMESYGGLAVLTTNMRNALDPAFTRRLSSIITFPFPGAAERERIWRGVFPAQPGKPGRSPVPGVEKLDPAVLARPALTGGQIRNIALDAAFRAAAANADVTMELLREAARDELRKGGRAFVAADYAAWTTREPVAAGSGGTR